MRTAICFYGLVGSETDKNGNGKTLDPKIGFELNKINVIDINNADVFIHSWSIDSKNELEELYKPKASIIENQKDFPDSLKILSNINFKQKFKEIFLRFFNSKEYKSIIKLRKKYAFRAFSRWYSNKQTLKLKEDYEAKHNFKYDAVLVLRLDVAFHKTLEMKNYDLSKFYASNWNDYPTKNNEFKINFNNNNRGKGFLDFWFFSNSHNMDKFGKLYDEIDKYLISPHSSSFQHAKSNKFNIDYTFYRWQDHEMIRRKKFLAAK
jgi:hypothetical protein